MMENGVEIIYARSIIMMLMVFIQNVNVLNCRSEKKSIFKTPFFSNPFAILTITGAILLQIVLAEIPFTAKFLGLTPIPISEIFYILLLSFIIIIIYEIYKIIYKTKKKRAI